ncbi:MAG: M23 family metallopeptidase [Candidatus Krumholzibacteria bacterium]|nr:M23 family metallopeptidase [Candidatus Krumholzibacteria bacterium]
MDRSFHVLWVRGANAGVKTMRVPRVLAMSVVIAAALLVSAVVLLATRAGRISNGISVRSLRTENARLSEELGRFRAEVDNLEARMDLSFELQNRARLIASLEPLSADVWQAGIGGAERGLDRMETAYPDSAFDTIDESLDQMLRQTEIQLASYSEVMSVLEKEEKIRNGTPSIRPLVGGFLSSRFGRRMDPFLGEAVHHSGLDYRARMGSPVMSSAGGVVSQARRNGGFGLMIEVSHENGFTTRYAHLSKILVTRGQKVKRGEIIGLVGNTGHSTGSHLHYEVLFRKVHRDPLQYVIPQGTSFD